MSLKIFLHGVPDTPAMWTPLIRELDLSNDEYLAPALPGFVGPPPAGFTSTKEQYVDWFIIELEQAVTQSGPVDVVGHDWGALIVVRAASLRPELFKSWTIANAAPHPDYKWHRMARLWQMPIVGELVMLAARRKAMQRALTEAGFPPDLAAIEAKHWSSEMKRAILRLYRSARNAGSDWYPDLKFLPSRGLVFWGEEDPYVPSWVAEKFSKQTGARLLTQPDVGHWSIIERAERLANLLKEHWLL